MLLYQMHRRTLQREIGNCLLSNATKLEQCADSHFYCNHDILRRLVTTIVLPTLCRLVNFSHEIIRK